MVWLYWVIMIIQFIFIVYLATKEPEVVEKFKDIPEEERLKFENEKIRRKSELKDYLSEVKEKSIQRIHDAEQEKIIELAQKRAAELLEIDEIKQKKYDELKEQMNFWEEEQKRKQEEYLRQAKSLRVLQSQELEQILKDQAEEFESKTIETKEEIETIETTLLEWKSKYDAALEVYKNFEKIKDADTYYRISFSTDEVEELDELNKVVRKLKNPTPFYKAIYEIYYKNKVNELGLRVVGNSKIAGIYKITHTESGKCYVGQSVDISARWKQHIKRAVGADTRTTNKLYPAMAELGVENFNFEIIEVVEDTNRLNELEKYWQEFLQAKEFGFSVR